MSVPAAGTWLSFCLPPPPLPHQTTPTSLADTTVNAGNVNKTRLNLGLRIRMGMNHWECEGNGNETRLNLGLRIRMGMNRWECEGIGLKNTFPLISAFSACHPRHGSPDALVSGFKCEEFQ